MLKTSNKVPRLSRLLYVLLLLSRSYSVLIVMDPNPNIQRSFL